MAARVFDTFHRHRDGGRGRESPLDTPKYGSAGTPLFVGREAELATLRRLLEASARGNGSLVLVAGEPGRGKTADYSS